MQTHVTRSAQLVETAARLRGSVQAMIRHHHENYDGNGYPDGLKGEDIPVGSRIIMVVDSYHAITSDRPYRKRRSKEEALQELRKGAGTQFDPKVVNAFESIVDTV